MRSSPARGRRCAPLGKLVASATVLASPCTHVANKELSAERAIDEAEIGGEPDTERWSEQLRQTARDMCRTSAS